ncbi:hypothetical protein B1H10_01475 [candidate division KSB1 bacterium 4484_188]|nr:MAG: hypothetical protein B1H10_01475 [candidate division KSB1 bacterium 4484_188]
MDAFLPLIRLKIYLFLIISNYTEMRKTELNGRQNWFASHSQNLKVTEIGSFISETIFPGDLIVNNNINLL